MHASTFNFRTPLDFAEQTKGLARFLGLSSSDYVRQAVKEKNERTMQARIAYLSQTLSQQNLQDNLEMQASLADGLD